MSEKEVLPPEKKKLSMKGVRAIIKEAFFPAILKTSVKSPALEQNKQVEKALDQSLGIALIAFVELFSHWFRIEYSSIDTRPNKKEKEKQPKNVRFINLTGVWGRASECVAEVKMLATAMGKLGLRMDLISLPEHGKTDNSPKGWGAGKQGEDYEAAADVVGAHILETKDNSPELSTVLNGWSAGGVTALKTAAKYPKLVDGLILIDTPVFPQDFKSLALRFITYELQKLRSVRSEKPFDIDVNDPGLGIFIKRIRDRNKEDGIPLKVVRESARSLAEQNLALDGTLDEIAKHANNPNPAERKNIPILIIVGSNDYVIPHDSQTIKLAKYLSDRGVDVVIKIVEAAGHAVVQEQPIKSGEIVREWMENKGLVEKEDQD